MKIFPIIIVLLIIGCNTTEMKRGKLLSEQMQLKEQLHNKEIQIEEWNYSRRNPDSQQQIQQAKNDTAAINRRLKKITEEIMYLDSIQFKK